MHDEGLLQQASDRFAVSSVAASGDAGKALVSPKEGMTTWRVSRGLLLGLKIMLNQIAVYDP
ncbi:MAG: hypothetical protein ACU83N_11905 [Gammaproteobacteria bacterium]